MSYFYLIAELMAKLIKADGILELETMDYRDFFEQYFEDLKGF